MNEYPVWWDTTITIYNKYTDPTTQVVSWFRHTIDGCFWDNTPLQTTAGTAQIAENDVLCRIRENPIYKPKMQWNALTTDEKAQFFTLGGGDIVVKGSVDDVITDQRDHRANDLISKYKDYQGCITIKRYSENVGAGRCMPHYYVVGE